ncbi:MAG: IS256 family transposase [Planctomycetota bacterium]
MAQRIPPSRRMEQEVFDGMSASTDPLGEAARRGAQLILQRTLEMEVEDFLGRGHYERSTAPTCRGWRNGYEPRKVQIAEGSIEIQVPQIRDSLEPFESIWLKAIGKRSKRLLDLVPMLYVKGMSQRDIEAALVEALGVEQTGRSVVNEVCRTLRADFERWQDRDMSEFELMYLFLDGIWLKLRPEDKRAVAVLCAYGILLDGGKVLLHLAVGDKESAACWEAFLEDMKRRGLKAPVLAVVDGNAGVRKALRRKMPDTLVQRCQVHKMRNILNKLPHLARPTLKKLIHKAFTARTCKEGLAQAGAIVEEYREAFPAAMKCLARDIEECLTALKFPFIHRRQIRTTNLLERLFGEGRRRTKVIPRLRSETSALSLVFAVLVDASEGWRGVRMKPYIARRLEQIAVDPDSLWEDPDLNKLAA